MNTNAPDCLTLKSAIVLYADLLGFSHQVAGVSGLQEATMLAAKLDRFAELFTESNEMAEYFGKKYWAFSDSIVVTWYEESQAAEAMTPFDAQLHQISGIASAQVELMRADSQLVRGGLGRGWFLEREETVLGNALVAAARLEKQMKGPFIAVEESLYQYFLGHPGRCMYAESIDPVPTTFIAPCDYTNHLPALDYLMVAVGDIDLTNAQIRAANALPSGRARDDFRSSSAWANKIEFLSWHRDFIMRGMSVPDETIVLKYSALKAHHNARVSEHFPRSEDLLIRPW